MPRMELLSEIVFFWQGRGVPLLTEQEVSRTWRTLFKGSDFSEEELSKAEALLEELRPESPLRHRLSGELEELRRIATASR